MSERWKLDGRHRWQFFLKGPFTISSGYWPSSYNWYFHAAFRCRACGIER
jgi:hypothetical protein